MGVYVQTKYMAMTWECFYFDFAVVQHVAPLCLRWPLAHLFPAAWESNTGQCTNYLSQMSMI